MSPLVVLIDSGVNARHPHLALAGEILAGPAFDDDGLVSADGGLVDEIGHGTAAAAAIVDLAPQARIISVRVFQRRLSCPFERVIDALQWACARGVGWVNLSLGTTRPEWREPLERLLRAAAREGTRVVAPAFLEGIPCLPGSLPEAIGVVEDPALARESPRSVAADGCTRWRASPYPRDLAGVPRTANFRGPSFAAANLTGFLVRQSECRSAPARAALPGPPPANE